MAGDRVFIFCLRRQGEHQRAHAMNIGLLPQYEEVHEAKSVALVHHQLACLLFEQGRCLDAVSHLRIALRRLRELGNRGVLIDVLEELAVVAAACGQPSPCVRLLGAAEALCSAMGLPLDDHRKIVPNLGDVRQLLGEHGLAAGMAMPFEQAVAVAEALCEALLPEPAGARIAASR